MEHNIHDALASFRPHCTHISISDLGTSTAQMKESWLKLYSLGQPIFLSEFPHIDICQVIDEQAGLSLMEFVLDVVAVLQEQQRAIAKEKQAIGIQLARDRGVRLGRKPLEIPFQFKELLPMLQQKKLTIKAATSILGVDYKTIKKWMTDLAQEREES